MLLFHEQAHNTETDGETEKTQQNTDRMPLSRTHKTAGVAKKTYDLSIHLFTAGSRVERIQLLRFLAGCRECV